MTKKKRALVHSLLALSLVAAGVLGMAALTMSKPPLSRKKPAKVLPVALVSQVRLQSLEMEVSGEGTVDPARESALSAEVAGRVVFMSPSLVEGGSFKKDQVLLKIDPVDYQLAVTLNQAKVREAETNQKTVQEESASSLEEWKRVGNQKGSAPPLVAKAPQLAEAQAKLEAAKAQLAQARLDLKRCVLRAPYDGQVQSKQVDLGQYLRKGDKVADVFSSEAAEIVVPLEDRELAWLKVPGLTSERDGSQAEVIARFAGRESTWQGRVVRAESKVDQNTRLVPVVIRVEKPYAKLPPLVPGLFVTVKIKGARLENAALIPRAALRQGGLVWVVDSQDIIHFRPVTVTRTWEENALIQSGLKKGERVVVSPLRAVIEGMKVKPSPAKSEDGK